MQSHTLPAAFGIMMRLAGMSRGPVFPPFAPIYERLSAELDGKNMTWDEVRLAVDRVCDELHRVTSESERARITDAIFGPPF